MATGVQIVIDCANPAQLSRFWAEALGYVLQPPPPGFDSWEAYLRAQQVPEPEWDAASAVIDPDGRGPRIYFQRVPEPKSVKNRLHMDVNAGGAYDTPPAERRARIDAGVEWVTAIGARVLEARDERDEYFVVMADPEGNEFCVI
jgi:hypothetical protein